MTIPLRDELPWFNWNLIGHTDLRKILELLYAHNAFMRIHRGKAVARVCGGRMLENTALYCFLISEIFNINVSIL